LTELQYIYNDLKDEYENVIIEKYNYNAKWYTIVLTSNINFLLYINTFSILDAKSNSIFLYEIYNIYIYNLFYNTIIFSSVFAACNITTFIVAQFWTSIINNILSKNVSQSRNLLITMEYFIDQEKHFYLIVLHTYAAISVGYIAMIAIGAILVAYLQHICGVLSISRYKTNTDKPQKF